MTRKRKLKTADVLRRMISASIEAAHLVGGMTVDEIRVLLLELVIKMKDVDFGEEKRVRRRTVSLAPTINSFDKAAD